MRFTLQAFAAFARDLPFDKIVGAAGAAGTNIPLDIAAAKGIMDAAVKDFFSEDTSELPATKAAVVAHVEANT